MRRVEPRKVTIWVALSEKATVAVKVWLNHQDTTAVSGEVKSGDPVWAEAAADPITVGKNLHIAVVTVEKKAPGVPLPPGTVCAYDVQILRADTSMTDLRGLGLLENGSGDADVDPKPPRLALGYEKNRLPSFVTCPPSADDLVVAHGSCRKTIGPGPDAIVYLDEVIEESVGLPLQRPHQLFLTGDQIYADDVSMLLLRNLNVLGRELFDRHEFLPVNVPQGTLTDVPADLTEFPVERRTRLIRDEAKMTSTAASNHLLSFAEFCAMYLAAWSPDVWEPLPTADDIYVKMETILAPLLTPFEACAIAKLEKEGRLTEADRANPTAVWKREKSSGDKSRFAEQKRLTEIYRRGVPHARRALANVATYMIFDDHEVTDDWNLTSQWRNRVYTSPLGRTVIRNGLLAYLLFQGWGNDPEAFAGGDGKKLLDHTTKLMTGAEPGPDKNEALEIDKLLGLSGSDPKVKWNYTIDGSTHRAVVLDTRTRRRYTGRVSPPDLLGETLQTQVPEGPLGGGLETLIVVSPVPVLGPVLIDAIGQPLRIVIDEFRVHTVKRLFPGQDPCAEDGDVLGLEEFDAESWARNDEALEGLLGRLSGYSSVVLLSGDVHYAMSLVLDYWKKGAAAKATSRLVQFTASPARNNFKPLVEHLIRAAAVGQTIERLGVPATRFAWKDSGEDNLALPQGSSVRPGIRARMNRDPVLVPGEGWPPGTTLAAEPDWRWRLDILRDPRTDAERPSALDTPGTMAADLDPDDAVDGYFRLARRHTIAAAQHYDHVRQMIFLNNVGVVRFRSDEDGKRLVRHEIISGDPTDPRRKTGEAPNTVHEVALAPPGTAPPPLVTLPPPEEPSDD